eukprot:6180691-Pleurochrysis_carterae.AAC.5
MATRYQMGAICGSPMFAATDLSGRYLYRQISVKRESSYWLDYGVLGPGAVSANASCVRLSFAAALAQRHMKY